MAIRIREVNGILVAICAARSIPKEGDIYLHDGIHHALSIKFGLDFAKEGFMAPFYENSVEALLMEQEESNNKNREWWDTVYGEDSNIDVSGCS